MSKFVHLHNHTDFSLLDGAAKIESYIAKAKEYNMDAIAITDHGNMFGAFSFYKMCKANSIKPIIGSEFYISPEDHITKESKSRYHMILLCQNNKGYENMIKLSSISYLEGFYYKPRISDSLLEKYNEGIICLSACLAGEIPSLLRVNNIDLAKERALYYKNLFKDRYYIEIQNHGTNEEDQVRPLLIKLAKDLDIPLVATNDIHYIEQYHYDAHDTLLCIGTGRKKKDENRMRYPNNQFYFKSSEQMIDLFKDTPEAISNTIKIANSCNLDLKLPRDIELPILDLPKGFKDENEYLKHLSYEGLKKRYGKKTKELCARLDYELNTIISLGFALYYLIVWDFIKWAKDNETPVGPGRGSGAGSLVAYCIEITDVDPMKYNLLFERFLNPDRVSMPDFDIDFCNEKRAGVIEYVTNKYGKDRVGQIATFGTLKTKAALKDVARVLDISITESNAISKMIPAELPINPESGKPYKMNISNLLKFNMEIKDIYDRGGLYKELFDTALILENMNRNISTHAAGVVIGKSNLNNYLPLYADSETKAVSTQYTKDELEDNGLVKMDFLGLKTLTVIKNTLRLIKEVDKNFDLQKIDEEDKKTFELLSAGNSACVFQFESKGMQDVLRNAKPDRIEDLVALTSLYRPGPMAYIDEFIAGKNGLKEIVYITPELEETLKLTYGVIVYQEQVMKVSQIVAGYTLAQADILRKIMGKKQVKELAHQEKIFIEGSINNGYSREKAQEIFNLLVPFASYGFNKSHAVAYSIISYRTAYLKAHYPSQFMAANLTNEINNPDKFKEYLSLTKQMDIKVRAPSINNSTLNFSVKNNDIIYGLAGIKNVGPNVVAMIIEEREKGPFKSFIDFLKRIPSKVNNVRVLEALIKSGCFDDFNMNRATLLFNLEAAQDFVKAGVKDKEMGQGLLFSEEEISGDFNMKMMREFDDQHILEMEKEFIGFYVSSHPLDAYSERINSCILVRLDDPKTFSSKNSLLIAQVESVTTRSYLSKRGKEEKFGILSLCDYNSCIPAVCFKPWVDLEKEIKKDQIYCFKGNFDNSRDGNYQFYIESLQDIDSLQAVALSEAHFILNADILTREGLTQLYNIFVSNTGSLSIYLHLESNNHKDELVKLNSSSYSLNYDKSLNEKFKKVLGYKEVYYK